MFHIGCGWNVDGHTEIYHVQNDSVGFTWMQWMAGMSGTLGLASSGYFTDAIDSVENVGNWMGAGDEVERYGHCGIL